MGDKLKMVKVVIPFYHEKLTESEKISLIQCKRILRRYPVCIIKPDHLLIQNEEVQGMQTEEFEGKWFQSVQAYNSLMLSPEFYERFSDYEYILIYQLDAFVFRDELDEFCSLGYDYIGAPWIYGQFAYINGNGGCYYTGNGGFSLRKVKAHLEVLKKYEITEDVAEDMFFSSRDKQDFQVAPMEIALKFAFETNVRKCYEKNNRRIPFGCHAWQKYDFSFYRKIFQAYGYDTVDIRDDRLDQKKFNDFFDLSALGENKFKDTLKTLFPEMKNEIWIWGTGKIGKECAWHMMNNHIKIKGFIDNNTQMQGKVLYESEISSPLRYFENTEEIPLIIAMAFVPEEINNRLTINNKSESKDYISWKKFYKVLSAEQ